MCDDGATESQARRGGKKADFLPPASPGVRPDLLSRLPPLTPWWWWTGFDHLDAPRASSAPAPSQSEQDVDAGLVVMQAWLLAGSIAPHAFGRRHWSIAKAWASTP
jgi:hypothetical protein